MSMRTGSALTAVALLAITAPAVAQAENPSPTITVSPSRTKGKAIAKRTYGAITLTNGLQNEVRVDVIPSLLRQDLRGGIFIDTRASAFRRAAALIRPQIKRFDLAPVTGQRSTLALLRRLPASGSFYGGLLFSSRPLLKGDTQQIQQVFRLNGSLYLDPTADRARVRFGGDAMRAAQAAPRQLDLITPVRNRGNWALAVAGEITVTDSGGRVRFRRRVKSPDVILPRATVEIAARLKQPVLPPGAYRLRGRWRTTHGERFETSGIMRLFGPNTVATHGASFTDVENESAYIGEPLEVHAGFENTGNVPFAPRVRAVVRRQLPSGDGPVFSRTQTRPDRVAPGKEGTADLKLRTPPGAGVYKVVIEAFAGRRLLDTHSLSLTPQKKPSFWTRVTDWLKDHALLVIALLVLLVVALLLIALATRRRRREPGPALHGYQPEPPPARAAAPRQPPAPAPAPVPDGDARIDINSAPLEQLMQLPGVGRRAAERILAHREANGPFRSLDELHAIEGFHHERIQRVAGSVKL